MINTGSYTLEEFQIKPNFSIEQELTDKGKARNKKNTKSSKSKQATVKIYTMDCKDLEIDFIGFHFSLINAYRRIVLAEVATVAIEKVYMYKNTSVVQDEVLSHRLGLVPLNVPPSFFNFRTSDSESFTAENCVKYKLKVKCRGKKDTRQSALRGEDDTDCTAVEKLVTSEDLVWVPIGNQAEVFASTPLTPLREEINLPVNVKTTNTDLVLAKLNPGQRLILEAYAFKGIGSDHAKFQPGLCWYRMLPQVTLNRRVLGQDAHTLKTCFSPGVIEVFTNKQGEEEARVVDARYDSCSRNVYNYENLRDAVSCTRKAEHIIFHVESHSALKSYEILEAAVDVMIEKCDSLLAELCKVEDE